MKRIIMIFLVLSQILCLSACFSKEKYILEFSNVNDRSIEKGETNVDLKSGVRVWQTDEDGKAVNVTSSLQIEIVDEKTNNVVDSISTSENGFYKAIYFVIDPSDVRHEESCTIKVGRPETDYDSESITYDLIFSDEFNGDTLDESIWNYEIGNGASGWGNNELQYYTKDPKNVSISDGTLKITAINESIYGYNYSSARLTTKNKKSFTYGKFEASIKVDSARGDWSAFWLLSETGSWPNEGEIDIMEHVGNDAGKFHANTHTERFHGGNLNGLGGSLNVSNFDTEFVIYGVEWLPDKMNFYINDEIYYTYKPSNLNSDGSVTRDVWPFDHNFFIILNVAVGGNWGGAGGVTSEDFPSGMEIDYVRVYQSPQINNLMGV